MALLGQFPNFFGFPLEAEKPPEEPSKKQAVMYLAIDDDDYSKQLDMELFKDWKKIQFRTREAAEEAESYNKESSAFYQMKYDMINLNGAIRARVKLEVVKDRSDMPAKCPAFRIGKNSKWETFPVEAFRDYGYPLKTVLYEIDLWYIIDWREALQERRYKAIQNVNVMNRSVYNINEKILQSIYGEKCSIYPVEQVTAMYWFDGKLWQKLASPEEGCLFIPDNIVASIQAQNKDKTIHKVEGYISGYEIRTDVYSDKMINIPIDGLNCRLMPETFPHVDVLPNPPWEPKYSFVPF